MPIDHPLFLYRHLDRSKLRDDSPRFRSRVAAAFDLISRARLDYSSQLKREAGIVAEERGYVRWDKFWNEHPIDEVLTAITIIYQYTITGAYSYNENEQLAEAFRESVAKALRDEHLGYRIEPNGTLHFAVDEDFEVARRATLAGLDDGRIQKTRELYEKSLACMNEHPPDTIGAVKNAFGAVEVLATQLVPAHKNLHVGLCKGDLKTVCVPNITVDQTETSALNQMFDSMGEWVNGIHYYRHEKWHTAAPTVDTAVLVITTASAYLRLLATVAAKVLPK